jgi:hypothetical protein
VGKQVVEFAVPFSGLTHAATHWAHGGDKLALMTVVLTVAVAIAALVRGGLRGPFGWAVAGHLALLAVLKFDVVGLDLNATRALLPLAVCALLGLVAARAPATLSHPAP